VIDNANVAMDASAKRLAASERHQVSLQLGTVSRHLVYRAL